MKKTMVILAITMICLFGFGTAAQAGFSNLFTFDFSSLKDTALETRDNMLEIGGIYGYENLLIGGGYSFNAGTGTKSTFTVYAGYDFISDQDYTFSFVLGYTDWREENILGKQDITLFGPGFLTAADFGEYDIALLFIYGMNQNYKLNGGTPASDIQSATYLQFNTDFYLNQTIGFGLIYRTYAFRLEDGVKWRDSGLGLGVTFKFE